MTPGVTTPLLDHLIIHYDEIGLKCSNRGSFERRLMKNIHHQLGDMVEKLKREQGQLTLTLSEGSNLQEACDELACVPGIAYFSPACKTDCTLEAMAEAAVAIAAQASWETFKIDAHRHDKTNRLRSMEVNRQLGAAVLNVMPERCARMKNPDLEIKVEMQKKTAYLSSQRIEGVGGLPTQPNQKVVALLSGGLDSPVAAWMMMKRGCSVTLVHFQNANQMANSVEDKIIQLAERLSHFQVETRLLIVPFDNLQNAIIAGVKAERRMLVYRKVMIRMASAVARKLEAPFLVVGDSFSQVASQTYDNLAATYANSPIHILSPLIGLDKRDISNLARRIGTFDISSLPYGDCCSYFLPKHPELRARPESLQRVLDEMDIDQLESDALNQARLYSWPEKRDEDNDG
jgi:thiamine biosynthesis protein ThiI